MDTVPSSEGAPADIQALKEKLRELVRYASSSRLKIHTDSPEIEVKELDAGFRPGRILANNMVFILMSGDALRVTFKVHFNIRNAQCLAFRIFGGDSPENISGKQAIDYFKEYGNLVAGNVVTLFEKIEVNLGISLPICTRGFYEVFSDYSEKQHPIIVYSDFWKLEVGEHDIFCSALLEILDKKQLVKLADYEIAEDVDDNDGEMDFL
jgi:CheY-specific phosphatase CheX